MKVEANVDSLVRAGPKTWVRLTVPECDRLGAVTVGVRQLLALRHNRPTGKFCVSDCRL